MQYVEIEFRGRRKGIYRNSEEYPLSTGDPVIVRSDRGEDLGWVRLSGAEWESILPALAGEEETLDVLRRATEQELEVEHAQAGELPEVKRHFKEKVEELDLDMKLVDAEYQFDRRKLTFYFTADGRVDFRELVKQLAQHFRTRIDLRQIGARDEAKRHGGIGICGRATCCATWIRDFHPVTTSMMKDQWLLLNPQKNTGLCGKLRCCLRYEVDMYRELNKKLPKVDTKVKGPRGEGRVEKLSLCHWGLGVRWEDGTRFSYSLDLLMAISNWDPEQKGSIKLVEFREDPSQAMLAEQKRAGRLVASSSPSDEAAERAAAADRSLAERTDSKQDKAGDKSRSRQGRRRGRGKGKGKSGGGDGQAQSSTSSGESKADSSGRSSGSKPGKSAQQGGKDSGEDKQGGQSKSSRRRGRGRRGGRRKGSGGGEEKSGGNKAPGSSGKSGERSEGGKNKGGASKRPPRSNRRPSGKGKGDNKGGSSSDGGRGGKQ